MSSALQRMQEIRKGDETVLKALQAMEREMDEEEAAQATKKPNIQEFFAALQSFHQSMMPSNMPPMRDLAAWTAQQQENIEVFRKKLDAMGLSEHIDWTNEEG